uniref:Uncharacterized protein n=1 Tax=Ciona savignyi TaxID=51511 RepID=H2Y406_CIOSA
MSSVTYTTQPVVFPVQQEHPGQKYSRPYTVLGVLQILIGVLSVILCGVSIGIIPNSTSAAQAAVGYIYYSIGSSIWYLVAGSLGVASGRNPSNCPITGALVVTIFAAIASGIMCLLESLTTVALNLVLTPGFFSFSSTTTLGPEEKDLVTKELAIHAVLAFLAGAQFIITIVHSGYCCAVNCCANKSYSGMVTGGTTVM